MEIWLFIYKRKSSNPDSGLEDFIIVDKDNVLLIYPKSKEQEIKSIVNQLKK